MEVLEATRAWVEVDLEAIGANVRLLRAHLQPTTQIMAVVKADAYGHGLLPVAKAALEAGATWLGVATVAEGVALRQGGVTAPLLLLCSPAPDEAEAIVQQQITPTLGDPTTLDALVKALATHGTKLPPPALHLEIETGMGRAGVQAEEAVTLWQQAQRGGWRVTGLMTHFADADGDLSPDSLTRQQQRRFQTVRTTLEQAGARFDWIHLCNSAATLALPDAHETLIRPGLLLYGILPPNATHCRPEWPLRPALTLKARVASVRSLPAGHPISYGATHHLTRPSRVATLLIGYGDGYPRRLSQRGEVLLRGQRVPILGRVCMDQMVVDVTDRPEVVPGDVAVCIGSQGEERIRAEHLAALLATTEHEITTCLTARLPRLYQP